MHHYPMTSLTMLLLMWMINLILWLQDTNLVRWSTTYHSNKTGYLSTTVQYYSTILTGIMCLHALLCVYMQLTNTNVKELEVEERIKKDLLIL